MVAFCSVGMFSALSNLGAGGGQDVQLVALANSILYGCFFIGGFFAGSVNVRPSRANPILQRLTLLRRTSSGPDSPCPSPCGLRPRKWMDGL